MTDPTNTTSGAEAIIRELDEALRKFFFSRVPADDAEDLLQECYLRVSRGLPDLQDHERIAGWVFRIARNLVVDHIRSKKTVARHQVEELVDEGPENATPDPDLVLQVGQWLAPLIDQLPEKYAEALRESEIKERTHKEIAEQLGMSISGVKSRVQRGRALLREKLNDCCLLKFDRRGALSDVERRIADDTNCCGPEDCC